MKQKPVIGIIGGKGAMGNWLVAFFEKSGVSVIIADRKTKLTSMQLARRADVVILAVPTTAIASVVGKIAPHLKPSALLADIASLKTEPLKTMVAVRCGVLGMHPLFGPLVQDPRGQRIVFVKQRANRWVSFLKRLFENNGITVLTMSAAAHDREVAYAQAFLHFLNLSWGAMLAQKKTLLLPFQTPNTLLQQFILARIVNQKPKLYADIQMQNPHFVPLLEEYARFVNRWQSVVRTRDTRAFEKLFASVRTRFAHILPLAQTKSAEVLSLLAHQKQPAPADVRIQKVAEYKVTHIAYLGPEGTHSWDAARVAFPRATLVPTASLGELFELLMREQCVYAVAPLENSVAGLVSETVRSLIDLPVYAAGSFTQEIHHCLASREQTFARITRVRSHPQALAQTKNWLAQHLPRAKLEPTASTAGAIPAHREPGVGYIVSRAAAKKYRLRTLAENIEDKPSATRFIVATRTTPQTYAGANALLLLFVRDRVGVLRDILSAFADRGLNLAALHSFPAPPGMGQYCFFVEVERPHRTVLQQTLAVLRTHCAIIRELGWV